MKHHCKWSRKPKRAQYSLEVTGKAGVFKDEIERRGPLRRIKAALHQQKHFWALPECQMWLPPIESGSPSTLPTIGWQTLKCLTQKLGSLPESIACSILSSVPRSNQLSLWLQIQKTPQGPGQGQGLNSGPCACKPCALALSYSPFRDDQPCPAKIRLLQRSTQGCACSHKGVSFLAVPEWTLSCPLDQLMRLLLP